VGPIAHEAANAAADFLCIGAFDEFATDAYDGLITIVSVHHRAMTLRELHNDHVAAAGTLVTDCLVGREAIPLTLESGIGAQDECYGPTHYWAARNHQNLRRRTATARAERFPALLLSDGYASASEEWIYAVPGTDYRAHLGQIMAIPVQPTCNRLWVRAHVKLWVTSGAAVPTGLRVYSCNRPPVLFDDTEAEPLTSSYLESVVTRNDGALGAGSWTIEGFVTIRRSSSADAMREDRAGGVEDFVRGGGTEGAAGVRGEERACGEQGGCVRWRSEGQRERGAVAERVGAAGHSFIVAAVPARIPSHYWPECVDLRAGSCGGKLGTRQHAC
jgi:hypothetical protein